MTVEELAKFLRKSAETDRERLDAIERLVGAATPCSGFDEIERELPAKARYVGPGPWLDAIRSTSHGRVQDDK
jgi:hypothetical protein